MAVRMVPSSIEIGGKSLNYAISDNFGSTWAVNVHGWFAGGGMYWRESAQIAEQTGWKVLNPSLPGFGGSERVDPEDGCIHTMAERIVRLLDAHGIRRAVILGHSMGGAVAVDFAANHPDRVLGVIYRDGAATPAWRKQTIRRAALPVEVLDLMVGRVISTTKMAWPDFRKNARSPAATLPAALQLLRIDLRDEVDALHDADVPMLCIWGRLDQITPPDGAYEFCEHAGGQPVWIWGSHSWMIARPLVQGRVLTRHPLGRAFAASL
jgi:pimeloyl-ACP methyl ester carboxylesterase